MARPPTTRRGTTRPTRRPRWRQLDDAYAILDRRGTRTDDADLAKPIGPAEGPWADEPMIDLVLHINREVIHHGAEIALLRDLYAHTDTTKEN